MLSYVTFLNLEPNSSALFTPMTYCIFVQLFNDSSKDCWYRSCKHSDEHCITVCDIEH